MRRAVDAPAEDEFPSVEWTGEYHAVPVRVIVVRASRGLWEWELFTYGKRLRWDSWSAHRPARTEVAALQRALALVARAYEIEEAPSSRARAEQYSRERERRLELKRQRERIAWERCPTLPGIE